MTEYDAFGRKVGEDPLAEAGWTSAPPPPPATAPQPLAGPAPPMAGPPAPPPSVGVGGFSRPPAPRGVRRRSSAATVVGLAVVFTILLAVAGFVFLIALGADAVEDAVPDPPAIVTEAPREPATGAAAPGEAATGLARGSLIRRSEFGRAVATLEKVDGARLVTLRVAADRIDAQLVTPDNRLRIVQVQPGGALREIASPGGQFGHLPTMPFERVDVRAPERLTRAAAERLGAPTARVDYLVLLGIADRATWSVFFKDGRHFQGDASGRIRGVS